MCWRCASSRCRATSRGRSCTPRPVVSIRRWGRCSSSRASTPGTSRTCCSTTCSVVGSPCCAGTTTHARFSAMSHSRTGKRWALGSLRCGPRPSCTGPDTTTPMSWWWVTEMVASSRGSTPTRTRCCSCAPTAASLVPASHSPLLNLPGPSRDLLDDIEHAIAEARSFVEDYDPELVVSFSPDHYNGFFYKVMPPFCIGTSARGVGDYGTHAGPLNVPETLATDCAKAVLDAGVDVA